MWYREVSSLKVPEIAERFVDGCIDIRCRVVRPERLGTKNPDPADVEIETDLVGETAEILTVEREFWQKQSINVYQNVNDRRDTLEMSCEAI